MNSLFKSTEIKKFLQINSLFDKFRTFIATLLPNTVCGILTGHRLLKMEYNALRVFKPLFES